jgi:ribose 5-phosphate isomerase
MWMVVLPLAVCSARQLNSRPSRRSTTKRVSSRIWFTAPRRKLMDFLGKQGIPWEVFPAARNPVSKAHNWQEMAVFAQGIEPHILTDR